MPVSGPAEPAARAWSAARACSRVSASSMCKKMLGSAYSRAARSASAASSAALTRRVRSASPSDWMLWNSESWVMASFDDGGHEEQALVCGRRVGHAGVALLGRRRRIGRVVAQAQGDVLVGGQRMGHGFDPGRVHGLQFFDQAQDAVAFLAGARLVVGIQPQAREPCQPGDILFGGCHFVLPRGRRQGAAGLSVCGCDRSGEKREFCKTFPSDPGLAIEDYKLSLLIPCGLPGLRLRSGGLGTVGTGSLARIHQTPILLVRPCSDSYAATFPATWRSTSERRIR